MEMFVAAATRLERVCTRGSSEEKESFVFSIFAEGAEQLNEKSECKKTHRTVSQDTNVMFLVRCPHFRG